MDELKAAIVACEADDGKRNEMSAYIEKTLAEALLRMEEIRLSSLPAESCPPMAAASACIAKTFPARHAAALLKEGSRLPERNPVKVESMSATSRTQVAKAGCSKAQRDEDREATLHVLRSEIEDLEAEAEADRVDIGATP